MNILHHITELKYVVNVKYIQMFII